VRQVLHVVTVAALCGLAFWFGQVRVAPHRTSVPAPTSSGALPLVKNETRRKSSSSPNINSLHSVAERLVFGAAVDALTAAEARTIYVTRGEGDDALLVAVLSLLHGHVLDSVPQWSSHLVRPKPCISAVVKTRDPSSRTLNLARAYIEIPTQVEQHVEVQAALSEWLAEALEVASKGWRRKLATAASLEQFAQLAEQAIQDVPVGRDAVLEYAVDCSKKRVGIICHLLIALLGSGDGLADVLWIADEMLVGGGGITLDELGVPRAYPPGLGTLGAVLSTILGGKARHEFLPPIGVGERNELETLLCTLPVGVDSPAHGLVVARSLSRLKGNPRAVDQLTYMALAGAAHSNNALVNLGSVTSVEYLTSTLGSELGPGGSDDDVVRSFSYILALSNARAGGVDDEKIATVYGDALRSWANTELQRDFRRQVLIILKNGNPIASLRPVLVELSESAEDRRAAGLAGKVLAEWD
jgi:hypothetical protein